MSTVSLVCPHIVVRRELLQRALASVLAQSRPFDQLVIPVDRHRQGAPLTLARGFNAVECEWVIFMADDDELEPECVEKLLACAETNGADVAYGWYTVIGGEDPRPWGFGVPFHAEMVHAIPGGGALIRSQCIRAIGGFPTPEITPQSITSGEDFLLWERLHASGANFVHLPERLYRWHHWAGNSSGLPSRWG